MKRTRQLFALLISMFVLLFAPQTAEATTEVHTLPAEVSTLSAYLNGQFASDEIGGRWWFEWGTTTAYGGVIGEFGFTAGSYSPTLWLGNLDPNTGYHFRLVVQTPFDPPYTYYYGEDQSFQTLSPTAPLFIGEPQVVFVSATDATERSSIVDGGLRAQWWIEYGTTPALGSSTTPAATGPTEQGLDIDGQLHNLQSSQTYFFRVVVENSIGRATSAIQSFATLQASPPPPPPPQPPPPTLYLTKSRGGVVTGPAGFSCSADATSCSLKAALGTSVTLTEIPEGGFKFVGWGGSCGSQGVQPTCTLTLTARADVSATFALKSIAPPPSPRCRVPRVVGLTLVKARALLRRNRCATGRVRYAASHSVRRGRVIAQSRRAGTRAVVGTRVGLTVSRGSKHFRRH